MPNPPITKITDQLYLGNGKSSRDPNILGEHNIIAVVSITAGRWVHWRQGWYKKIIPEGNHLYIPCNDSMTQDLLAELADICKFIDNHLGSGPVLVHCDQGVSRSATAVIAYLMQHYQYDLTAALAFVKGKRKVKPNDNFMDQLRVWEAVGGDIWAAPGIPKDQYKAYLDERQKRLEEAGLTGDEPIGVPIM